MTYYPTLDDDDLARAKVMLATGHKAKPPDIHAAYRLLESFVAAIEQFQRDQRMLATILRNTVVAITDNDDWEGSAADAVDLLITHVAALNGLLAENEQLRAGLDTAASSAVALQRTLVQCQVQVARQREELAKANETVETLRAAAETVERLQADRITAITARCGVCGAYCDDITVERASDRRGAG